MRSFRGKSEARVTRFAEGINEVIGHPLTFVVALIQTLVWTVIAVVTTLDKHGFWFLYFATAVSYVTQFTLTLVSLQAKREARNAAELAAMSEKRTLELLVAVHAAVTGMRALLQAIKHEMDENDEILDEIHGRIHEGDG